MKHIVAINASPRIRWNTAMLVDEAARGAREAGAEMLKAKDSQYLSVCSRTILTSPSSVFSLAARSAKPSAVC